MNLSYANLKQCSDELHSSFGNIKSILEKVIEIKNQLSKGESWSGSASQHYVNKLGNLTSNFEEIYIELEKSALYLDKILEGYEIIDKKIISN